MPADRQVERITVYTMRKRLWSPCQHAAKCGYGWNVISLYKKNMLLVGPNRIVSQNIHALAPGDTANKWLAHSTRQGTSEVALISADVSLNTIAGMLTCHAGDGAPGRYVHKCSRRSCLVYTTGPMIAASGLHKKFATSHEKT